MAIDRRTLLAGLMAGAFAPKLVHAESRQLYLSCRLDHAGDASVCCFDRDGIEIFKTNLPSRGHDTVKRPEHNEIVIFSRRPGDWFVAIDSLGGDLRHSVAASIGRAFYGHGAFSADGKLLFATENNTASDEGIIGIYDATAGYQRVGELPTYGIGPHDMMPAENGEHLLIANGGLRTDPATGREEDTISSANSGLVRIDVRSGKRVDLVELDTQFKPLSLRHLALAPDGTVAFGCQMNRDIDDLIPLVGTISPQGQLKLLQSSELDLAQMKNYVGSVAFNADGTLVAATSPHGNQVMMWSTADARYIRAIPKSDVCGIAAMGQGFVSSSGNSGLTRLGVSSSVDLVHVETNWVWDNHMISYAM